MRPRPAGSAVEADCGRPAVSQPDHMYKAAVLVSRSAATASDPPWPIVVRRAAEEQSWCLKKAPPFPGGVFALRQRACVCWRHKQVWEDFMDLPQTGFLAAWASPRRYRSALAQDATQAAPMEESGCGDAAAPRRFPSR